MALLSCLPYVCFLVVAVVCCVCLLALGFVCCLSWLLVAIYIDCLLGVCCYFFSSFGGLILVVDSGYCWLLFSCIFVGFVNGC